MAGRLAATVDASSEQWGRDSRVQWQKRGARGTGDAKCTPRSWMLTCEHSTVPGGAAGRRRASAHCGIPEQPEAGRLHTACTGAEDSSSGPRYTCPEAMHKNR